MTTEITINSDGACRGNPGPGGFAAIIEIDAALHTVSGGEPASTNNRMELAAVIEALAYLATLPDTAARPLRVRSDSTYITNAFNKGWLANWRDEQFEGRRNADLWRRLDSLTRHRTINWTWVRAHAGDPMNQRCDRIAVARAAQAAGRHSYWKQLDSPSQSS